MRAAVFDEYGGPEVLHLEELEDPTPQHDEVQVRVRACAIRYGDLMIRDLPAVTPASFNMPTPLLLPVRMWFGWRRPRNRILGSEFSGEVSAVGGSVTRFRPGDAVMGYRGPAMGANAEYVCMAEHGMVAHKPANVTFEQAAAVPYGAVTALGVLRRVQVRPADRVLINGASGAIGSAALQICKHHFGAEVTGVCGPERMDLVRALGADHVIDYRQQDFTTSGGTWDLVLDVLGRSSFSRVRPVLAPDGTYLLASFKTRQVLEMLWTRRGGPRMVCTLAEDDPKHLHAARELVDAGQLTAVVDRTFPLEQVADAHRYVESGRHRGVVVVTI